MSLICEICHEVPQQAVISPVSGHIYERRLVEKYIETNGTDPVSGEPLKVEQLIDVKATPQLKPRPLTATSIPALLKIFQDEWDAVMLHSFTLKQQLQITRQELSHTLHQHDSTCRMASRLTQEVTAAREALATLKPHSAAAVAAGGGDTAGAAAAAGRPEEVEAMAVDEGVEVAEITEEVIKKLQDNASMLTAERKKRGKTVPKELTPSDDVRAFHQTASHVGLHSASLPGILSLDIYQKDSNRIVTGGVDKNAVVFNRASESVVAILKGHSKKVTSVIHHPKEDAVFTASTDHTIRVWPVHDNSPCSHVIKPHSAPVSGFSLHATGDYLLSASSDGLWAFSDVHTGSVLSRVNANNTAKQPLTCAEFHPDGLIFGTGTQDSEVKIWDLKERTNVANFTGHQGPVTAISFSENGFYLATAASDAVVKLWDLRKLKNFKNISLDDHYEVKSLSFDQSGTYLAVAGTDVRVYLCKQWQELLVLNDHTAICTDVSFGQHSSFLATTSMDRSLKIFSL